MSLYVPVYILAFGRVASIAKGDVRSLLEGDVFGEEESLSSQPAGGGVVEIEDG